MKSATTSTETNGQVMAKFHWYNGAPWYKGEGGRLLIPTSDQFVSLVKARDAFSRELLSSALRALCLTRDYVGESLLPAIKGWDWFDAGSAIAKEIPDDEWAEQFQLRVNLWRERRMKEEEGITEQDIADTKPDSLQ